MIYDLTKIRRVQIELSSRCNASCPACSRNYSGGMVVTDFEQVDLSTNDMRAFFTPEIIKNIEHINYCGNLGDPGLVKDLPDTLLYFKVYGSKNLKQVVRTNGGMRGPEHWAKIARLLPKPNFKPDFPFSKSGVVFGVDGLEDTNHIYRRGVVWNKVWDNMKAYSEAGGYGIWEYLIFDHNKHQVDEARALAESLGFTFILKTPLGFGEQEGIKRSLNVHDKDGNFEYAIWPHDHVGERVVPKHSKEYKISIDRFSNHIPILSKYSSTLGKESVIKCKSFEYTEHQEIFISASGHLLPCCYLGGAFGQRNTSYARYQFNDKIDKTGLDEFDLRKHSLVDILSGPKFNNFFDDAWNKDSVENGKMLFCAEVCGEKSSHDKIYEKGITSGPKV